MTSPLPKLRLYHYWRSTSSWRVRWALALKGVDAELVVVNLLDGSSESPQHLARNPMGYVPVIEILGSSTAPFTTLCESLPIIEWLEETIPSPPLLPRDPLLRARARQLAELINSGTQPLQNPNVASMHSTDPAEQKRWNQHWIRNGLAAYEALLLETVGQFSMGDALSLPDLFLIPQCYNARRFEVPLEEFPVISRIEAHALETPTCRASHPSNFEPKT